MEEHEMDTGIVQGHMGLYSWCVGKEKRTQRLNNYYLRRTSMEKNTENELEGGIRSVYEVHNVKARISNVDACLPGPPK